MSVSYYCCCDGYYDAGALQFSEVHHSYQPPAAIVAMCAHPVACAIISQPF